MHYAAAQIMGHFSKVHACTRDNRSLNRILWRKSIKTPQLIALLYILFGKALWQRHRQQGKTLERTPHEDVFNAAASHASTPHVHGELLLATTFATATTEESVEHFKWIAGTLHMGRMLCN